MPGEAKSPGHVVRFAVDVRRIEDARVCVACRDVVTLSVELSERSAHSPIGSICLCRPCVLLLREGVRDEVEADRCPFCGSGFELDARGACPDCGALVDETESDGHGARRG